MADQKENSYRLLWMLGLAITLPMILLSGPIAGYLISLLLTKHFGVPAVWVPICMALGLAGSGFQAFRLIQKLKKTTDLKKTD